MVADMELYKVADMAADKKKPDMELHMAADMEVDKVADMVADIEADKKIEGTQFGKKKKKGTLLLAKLSTSMSATMLTTAMSSRRFVRSQRR